MNLKHFCLTIIISLFLLAPCTTHSQFFSKFGIKFGFSLTGITTNNLYPALNNKKQPNNFIEDSTTYFSHPSVDAGIFAEFFNSEKFCVSTEIHYLLRGEGTSEYTTNIRKQIPWGEYYYVRGTVFDKSEYLSLQLLPRYRVGIGRFNDNIYFFAGPTFDFMISDDSKFSDTKYIDAPGLCDAGVAMGIGFELLKVITFEMKYFHDFNGPYDFKIDKDVITRRYNSLYVLASYTILDRSKHKK